MRKHGRGKADDSAGEAGTILFRVKKTREQQILEFAAEGLTDKLIAGRLGIQVGTVGTYWRRIRRKFGASNRSQAIAKSLKQSADALAAILGALHDLVFVHDARGVFLDYFAEDPSQLFLAPSDFLGKTILETMPSSLGARIDAVRCEVLRTGKPGIVEYELPNNGITGCYVATIVRLDESRTLTDVRDVTDERRAQKEVAALLAAIPDILVRVSRTGVILQAKVPEGIPRLWPVDEAVGKSVFDALSAEQGSVALETIQRSLSMGKVQTFHCVVPYVEGSRTYEVRVVPSGDDEVLAVARDVTASSAAL